TAAMRDALIRCMETAAPDIVQVESTNMADYVEQLGNLPTRPAIVYDWHNIESELMRRYAEQSDSFGKRVYANRTATLLESTEASMLARGDAHIVCSDRERVELRRLAPSAAIHTVPNGVDTKAFSPAANQAKFRLLFVGVMDYHANILAATTFAREVWPT